FKKYYILYLIINNIFTADFEAAQSEEPDAPAEPGQDLSQDFQDGSGEDEAVSEEPSVVEEPVAVEEPVSEEESGPVTEQPSDEVADVPDDTEEPQADDAEPSFTGDLSTDINYERLIENGEFVDKATMSASDIQAFLESRNSCLKDIYRGKYPSQIIYDVCQEYGINPKIMLVSFQKEQGLISKTSATEYRLDWALGVGCYDDGTKNARFRGFEKQISSAARVYRHWYDDGVAKDISANGYRMRVNYNTTYQYMENEATYSLYRYTPHTYDIHLSTHGGGNLLFARVYITYFEGFIR
ncbi:MAG: hypothetical protein ACOCWO_01975, partial [Candidatus Muiribacteriaceae bacterium]